MKLDVDWQNVPAAIWRPHGRYLRAVRRADPIRLDDLLGIDDQKRRLVDNTRRMLEGRPANNALLWGARGTGKSSLVKALLNEYAGEGLRLIQVDKDELVLLPEIVDSVRELDFSFVLFCDDISFEAGDGSYKALKSAIEGSIEAPPPNVYIYATSNRRHLLPESMQDNLDARLVGQEIHHGDAVEEKISLSERFGLWLGFYPPTLEQYLAVVEHLFREHDTERDRLLEQACDFARVRGSHSGRTARQFFNHYSARSR